MWYRGGGEGHTKKMRVLEAEFAKSASRREDWPRDGRREVAFVGRSNVGKSTMINRLAQREGLARVSSTPGRTRTLNFFDLVIQAGGRQHEVRFCDLPGYGFAKVSKAERAQWARMIETYLEHREPLVGVVVIVDARVGPTDDDLQMIEWLRAKERHAIVVATKLDKLSKAKRIPTLSAIERRLSLPVVGFSAEDGTGWDTVWKEILRA